MAQIGAHPPGLERADDGGQRGAAEDLVGDGGEQTCQLLLLLLGLDLLPKRFQLGWHCGVLWLCGESAHALQQTCLTSTEMQLPPSRN